MIRYKKAEVKWNGGNGALLCNKCRKIIAYGFYHDDKEYTCGECEKKMEKNNG